MMNMMKLNIQLFAASKSTSFSESVDKANNRSNLSITITFSANNSSTWFNSKALKCTCNGEEQSKSVSLSKGGKVSVTFTFTNISHNEDGKKSVSWSWSISTGTSVLGTLSDSGTRMLTTIPRASDITASNADIGSSTIIVINKKASSFTTTIDYKFENETSWTNIVNKTSNTTYGWTLPESFYNQIPNKKYGVVTLRATTYDGSTKIGEKTTTFNAFANEELCKPVISNVGAIDTCEATVLLTGDNTKFIKYESAPMLSWDVSPKNGASIISQKVNAVETVSPYSPVNWSDSYKLVVTDSRGYQATYDFNLTAIDYFYPQITATGKRKTSTSSNIILNLSGKFFNGYFSENIKNTATFKCEYKKKEDNEWTTIVLEPTINADGSFSLNNFDLGGICDYKYSWQFSITVTDKITSQGSNFPITKGNPIYYWFEKLGKNFLKVNGELIVKDSIKIGTTNIKDLFKPTVLFSNDAGTKENITLSDSAANYEYLEIFFTNNDRTYNSVKVYKPNGKIVSLMSIYNNNDDRIWFKTALYTISGTTMFVGNNVEARLINNSSVGVWNGNNVYITRVIGYNKIQ